VGRGDRAGYFHNFLLVQMKTLPISQVGAAVLRHTARPIDLPISAAVLELAKDLIHTADVSNGVGIAAPQVARSLRLFILASRPSPRYPQAPTMEPIAIINPVLLQQSPETILGWEGCLSVPGVRAMVPRSRWVDVEYLNSQGEIQQQRFHDFVARIFQHELDHLNGLLFMDWVQPKDLISEEEYQRICFDPLDTRELPDL
jgi:peptide deformylase